MSVLPSLIGAFVFRNEGNGCLLGKYINNDQKGIFPECCKLKGEKQNGFEGTYTTTWIQELTNQVVPGTLKIVEKPTDKFILEWQDSENKNKYTGIGMLHGDLLIGSYWMV